MKSLNDVAIERSLTKIVQELDSVNALPPGRISSVMELVESADWAEAVESICEGLHEFDSRVSQKFIKNLVDTARVVGVRSSFWENLSGSDSTY